MRRLTASYDIVEARIIEPCDSVWRGRPRSYQFVGCSLFFNL